MATWDQWMDAYGQAYAAVPAEPPTVCPNCGARTLRLVFTGDTAAKIGYAAFWCDSCLHGIMISRALIPTGAVVRDRHATAELRQPVIPDFTLVPPE